MATSKGKDVTDTVKTTTTTSGTTSTGKLKGSTSTKETTTTKKKKPASKKYSLQTTTVVDEESGERATVLKEVWQDMTDEEKAVFIQEVLPTGGGTSTTSTNVPITATPTKVTEADKKLAEKYGTTAEKIAGLRAIQGKVDAATFRRIVLLTLNKQGITTAPTSPSKKNYQAIDEGANTGNWDLVDDATKLKITKAIESIPTEDREEFQGLPYETQLYQLAEIAGIDPATLDKQLGRKGSAVGGVVPSTEGVAPTGGTAQGGPAAENEHMRSGPSVEEQLTSAREGARDILGQIGEAQSAASPTARTIQELIKSASQNKEIQDIGGHAVAGGIESMAGAAGINTPIGGPLGFLLGMKNFMDRDVTPHIRDFVDENNLHTDQMNLDFGRVPGVNWLGEQLSAPSRPNIGGNVAPSEETGQNFGGIWDLIQKWREGNTPSAPSATTPPGMNPFAEWFAKLIGRK